MHTVLLIDDDFEVLELNAKFLKNKGYQVVLAPNAEAGRKAIKKKQIDCIVLDVMMPKIDGFTACKEFRKLVDVPIIFLTGRTSEEDKVKGLLLGADDYIVKPYSLNELAVRILVNIRRYKALNQSATKVSYPPLSIDLTLHKAYFEEEEIPLSNREFELLFFLVNHKNQAVTFQEIGEKLWGSYSEVDRRSIMVNASRLRKKLDGYPGLSNMIETVWSKGYKFVY
ncbi:MAG: response regulator transcription factor [Clostridiales bacterium]|nr:response regulator transcription factor [Clostridiales bacterium]